MDTTHSSRLVRMLLIAAMLTAFILGASQYSFAAASKEMLYIGGYDVVFAVDPITKDVTEIPVKGPARDMTWTKDGRTLFVNTDGRRTIAVIDTIKNEVIDELTFSKDGVVAKPYGLAVDHAGEKLYATLMRSKREGTELKALPPVIQVMDLKTKEIVKEIDVPWGTHTLQVMEDGKKLIVWAKDIYLYDIEKDELKLHAPIMNKEDVSKGLGNYLYFWVRGVDNHNVALSTSYKFYPETGEVTEGFITVDMKTGETEEVELDIGPLEQLGLFSGALTKDRKTAFVGMNYIGKVDMETKKYVQVVPNVPGTSYGYNLSHDDKTLYVSGAGPDVSFYDAETLELQETIQLSTDTMDIREIIIQQ